jgi:hypothetical protein
MATINTILAKVETKLNDSGNAVWDAPTLTDFIKTALTGLYPYYYRSLVDTTTAVAGCVQTMPSGAKNLYRIQLLKTSGRRARNLRHWSEGATTAIIQIANATGGTLLWAWTDGWEVPATDDTAIPELPNEAEEAIIIKACIMALEQLLTDQEKAQVYYAVQVRQGRTEQDIALTLDTLHASLERKFKAALPLPEKRV